MAVYFEQKIPSWKTMMVGAFACLSLAGCRDQNFDFEEHYYMEAEQMYEKTFGDTFGSIDPDHTWMSFGEATITVNVSSSSNISIFDANGKISGYYEDVVGTKTLKFDAPIGSDDVFVVCNGRAIASKICETISLDGTRAGQYGTTGIVTVSQGEHIEFNKAKAIEYRDYLPEGQHADNATLAQTNLGKVTQNYSLVSNGPITLYPVYWQTSGDDVIGVYYFKDGESNPTTVPVYRIRSGEELQYTTNGRTWTNVTSGSADKHSSLYPFNENNATLERSRGIVVDIPKGTQFGFYIKQGNNTMYSQSNLNYTYYNTNRGFNDRDWHACHVATFEMGQGDEKTQYVCFEDWKNGDFDLNDIVLRYDGAPTILDEDRPGFTLAFEDMGSIGDFDFNDVVLQIGGRKAGESSSSITLAAAGATYHIEVLYDQAGTGNFKDAEVLEFKTGKSEVHEVFGVSQSTMVNTWANGADRKDAVKIASFDFGDASLTNTEIAKRFCLRVLPTKPLKENQADEYRYIRIPDNERGAAPQGFAVSSLKWAWPSERQPIQEKYPQFMDWVHDYLTGNGWWAQFSNENFSDVDED